MMIIESNEREWGECLDYFDNENTTDKMEMAGLQVERIDHDRYEVEVSDDLDRAIAELQKVIDAN